MIVIEALFLFCIVFLCIYGLNSLVLVFLYLRHRDDPTPSPLPPAEWPRVTVQLPVYNELHIIERLLTAAAALDYPRDRCEFQMLDDSTDETRQIAAQAVARLQEQGINVVHITRPDREDYKAGALAAGLAKARGELIAIFDADFVPPAGFLRRVVPHFADPGVGCVQTRWGHLNRDYSPLTRAQALGIDGHFVVEQTARSRAGLFLNFNGTGGVWRRDCIADAGGWQGDTLTEDLDLSYRAQLRGWRIAYLPDVVVPAEVPVQISALKRQQARWAQGSIETALKLIGPLLRSRQPGLVKLEGIIHLTGYLVHPLMLLAILLILPMSFSNSWVLSVSPWLMGMAAGPPLLYLVAQRGKPWSHRLRLLPLLELLGIGLALNNTWAVARGILGIRQGFLRTPKFALLEPADRWVSRRYALSGAPFIWGELLLSLFAATLVIVPVVNAGFVPWLFLYAGSFGYVAGVSLYQSRQLRRWLATQPRSAPHREGRIPASGPGCTRADCAGPGR
jgi:cellulose synthase/poly-beta-1,6-N-acetylglucosamine synthase-like glycosyltransferase